MPKKASPPTDLTQRTLFGYFAQQPSSPQTQKPIMVRGRKRKHAASSSTVKRSSRNDEEEPEGGNSSSDVDTIRFEPRKLIVISSDEEDESSSPRRPAVKRVKPTQRQLSGDSRSASSAAASDNDEQTHVEKPSPAITKGKGVARVLHEQDSSDEDELPVRRKLVKGKRPPTPDDEDEDEDVLGEVNEDAIIDTRLRSRNKKSAFQKNLDRLKRKKGMAVASSEESENDTSEDDEERMSRPFFGAKPSGAGALSTDDEDVDDEDKDEDDDFIVEDDGSASAPALPFAFSMSSHQDLAHHFKILCQMFVHMAVRPADEREAFMEETLKDNEYFSIPLQIARRKLSEVRDSLIASSVWRPQFKKALETFPQFSLTRLDFSVPECDACHLGGRVSTLIGRLSGDPYSRLSFEPEDDDDSSDSSDSDERSSLRKEFHLGRFCATRTRAYHKFSHWEYSLFEALLAEVDSLRNTGGKRQFVRTGYAKGLLPPEDASDADAIMDWLDERGVINFEWHNVRQMMDDATKLEAQANSSKAEDVDLDV
ncbi:hypothetical protein DENSPDRAFT_837066 [Dentipellis sp. KUC8613]|nr:hypothetical protein DENSPDRAFT_837066 [Dentipellis sp. KUC8613]